jgi:uncharacterized membrane protein YqjE
MGQTDSSPDGLFVSIRRLGETLLAVVQNRLELAAVELGEEKHRLVDALMWAMMTVVLATVTVLFVFRDNALPVLLGFCLAYMAASVTAFAMLRRRLKNWPLPFTHTLAEMKKDRECLQGRR